MLKWKYALLIISLTAFAIGFSDAQPTMLFYMGRPVGAALFGLFLIAQVLEKESALFDEQMRATAQARSPNLSAPSTRNCSVIREGITTPALTAAH